jgi:hypothetical protein
MKKWNRRIITILGFFIIFLIGCMDFAETPSNDFSGLSTQELIVIIKDPEAPDFLTAVNELSRRGPEASEAAPDLAQALMYPRRDSFIVSDALAVMGTEGKAAIPYLLMALKNDRALVREKAVYNLGVIGKDAQCSVEEIALLLWDEDGFVRVSAAIALDKITGEELVYSYSAGGDEFDGDKFFFSKKARSWWEKTGTYYDWSSDNQNCLVGE